MEDKEGVSVCAVLFWVKETPEKGKWFLEQCSKRTHAVARGAGHQ